MPAVKPPLDGLSIQRAPCGGARSVSRHLNKTHGSGGLRDPFTGDLPCRDVDAVEGVDERNLDDECCERRLVVMPGGFGSDLVADRVGAIADARQLLGQRERRAFRLGEIGRVAPGGDREQALVGFAPLAGVRAHACRRTRCSR